MTRILLPMKLITTTVLAISQLFLFIPVTWAWSLSSSSSLDSTKPTVVSVSRRHFVSASSGAASAAFWLSSSSQWQKQPAAAFDGSGASASAGYNPSSTAQKMQNYKDRIVADVKDFNALGEAIAKGRTEGKEWVNFFIEQQRREADSVGRVYAALADLRGIRTKGGEFEGGDGILLANLFTKKGKPPDNTPAVKSFKKLRPAFDYIAAAGEKGDAAKAKAEW
eukprot:CAMPEP_0113313452 /NCGR_PEP_ID=MMETSP0010_2-20120614/9871_1 /TAXON_ID=216773 ORGANISM="Corethron hystrix, Strain 308" /NCGR_SAMPLE_ID=MMETSP0010_2 /ASSEMBLY_ACC=CAM_ASM_000155 /LENGTH=222 /DNA_ID=CAMNT_0000169469 /DNA_START=22 /DNA_END=687 /DNA_ORIENTATION=- /assembly_acc=CAM_ASM_000155